MLFNKKIGEKIAKLSLNLSPFLILQRFFEMYNEWQLRHSIIQLFILRLSGDLRGLNK